MHAVEAHKLSCPNKAAWNALTPAQQSALSKKWCLEDAASGDASRVAAVHAAPAPLLAQASLRQQGPVPPAPAAKRSQPETTSGIRGWARFRGFSVISSNKQQQQQQDQAPPGAQPPQQQQQEQAPPGAVPPPAEQQQPPPEEQQPTDSPDEVYYDL